jgi:hypothetical protein
MFSDEIIGAPNTRQTRNHWATHHDLLVAANSRNAIGMPSIGEYVPHPHP